MLTDPKLRSQVDALCADRPEGFGWATRLVCASLRDEKLTREQATFGTF